MAAHASLFALVDRVVRSEKTPLLEGSVVMSLTHKVKPQLLRRNVKRFRGGLVFKAHGLAYHSSPGSRAIKKKFQLGL